MSEIRCSRCGLPAEFKSLHAGEADCIVALRAALAATIEAEQAFLRRLLDGARGSQRDWDRMFNQMIANVERLALKLEADTTRTARRTPMSGSGRVEDNAPMPSPLLDVPKQISFLTALADDLERWVQALRRQIA